MKSSSVETHPQAYGESLSVDDRTSVSQSSKTAFSDAAVAFQPTKKKKEVLGRSSGIVTSLSGTPSTDLTEEETLSSSNNPSTTTSNRRISAAEDSIVISRTFLSTKGGSSFYVAPRSSQATRNSLNDWTINKLNFGKLALHGRDAEIQQLKDAFDNVRNPEYKATQVVFLSGYSGTGKSRLATELEQTVKSTPGFFVQGKFDFQQKGQPYSGIASACRELCRQIVCFEELPGNKAGVTYEDLRNALTKELGNERLLLTEVIPGLREIFGFDSPEEREMQKANHDVDKLEGRNRFNFAFRRFLRVVASFGPVVLVVDDLQWADGSSLDLLEVLVRDVENPALMLVGCYRSNELEEGHPAAKFIRDLGNSSKEEDCLSVTELVIENLGAKKTNDIISDLLSMEASRTERLSNIVYERTHGNVFYVLQLMLALQNHELISFNFGTMAWTWDEKVIESSTRITTNVIDLVLERLTSRIDPAVATLLPVAAYLGSSFKSSTFEYVASTIPMGELLSFLDAPQLVSRMAESPQLVYQDWFDTCLREGILVSCGEDSFRFIHDKVEEAALALVAKEQEKFLGFRIGTVLLQMPSTSIEGEILFVATNLLNMGVDLIRDNQEQKLALAKLNLEAGQHSQSLSAFDVSNLHFKMAMNLLPSNHWETDYDLSLDIFNSAADAAYCTADWDEMRRICQAIISQKQRPIADKYRAHRLRLEGLVICNDFDEAEKECLETLKLIGCTFPRGEFLQTISLIKGVLRAKKLVAQTSEEDLRAFPLLEDSEKEFGLLVMETLIAAAMGTGSKMIALPLLRQCEWMFEYGLTSQSNVVFSGIGLVLMAIVGDLKLGQKASRFGQLVYDRTRMKSTEARMLVCRYGLTLHMLEPFSECMQKTLAGYRSGMEIGDLNYAMWSIQLFLMLAQCSGRQLSSLNADYPFYLKQMKESKQQPAADFAIVHWQAIHNLMGLGGSTDPTVLTGDVMNQEATVKDLTETKKVAVIDLLDSRRIYLGCFFGQHIFAADLALKLGDKFYQNSPGWPTFVETFYFAALSCVSAYKETNKRKYLRYAKAQEKKVKAWLQQGSANFVHWGLLLKSELFVLKRSIDPRKAVAFFQKAILAAAHTGRIHEQALARVRMGEYLVSIGDEEDALFQFRQARRLYDEWGAKAVADRLVRKYSRLEEVPTSLAFP